MKKTKNLVMCSLFVALMVVGAFIKIPVPVVPFTLQLLFTMMAGLLLGGKLGAVSVGVYILMGLLGLPIFAEGGGFAYVLKPSFGYIIGFAVASYVTGMIANRVPDPSYKRLLAANFIGLGIVYLFGMVYYYFLMYINAAVLQRIFQDGGLLCCSVGLADGFMNPGQIPGLDHQTKTSESYRYNTPDMSLQSPSEDSFPAQYTPDAPYSVDPPRGNRHRCRC